MKTVIVAAALCGLSANSAWAQAGASEKEVLRLFDQLSVAQIKKDRATMERLMADDYVYIHSNGTVANKAQDIAENMSAEQGWTSTKSANLKVRIYGDVAVVTGSQTLIGQAKGYVPGERLVTDLWVKRNGQWVNVGGQTTLAKK